MARLKELYFTAKSFVLKHTDPALFLFLLMVTNYRFSFKILALILIYAYRPDFKIGKSGVIYFYIGIIILALVHVLFIGRDFSPDHLINLFAGCLIWLACLLTYHQVRLSVEKSSINKLINTLKIISVLNLICSLIELVQIMVITHSLNPYSQISPPPYGISSGDLIGGVFGELHLVNMIISFMMLLFFLYRRNFLFCVVAVLPFLLTGSNLGSLITVAVLIFILLTKKDLIVKYYILLCIGIVTVFYIKVTPVNLNYLQATLEKAIHQFVNKPMAVHENIDELKSDRKEEVIKEEKIQKYIKIKYHKAEKDEKVYHLKKANEEKSIEQIEKKYLYHYRDSLKNTKLMDKKFEYGMLQKFDLDEKSGKAISFNQTKDFLINDWKNLMFGAGLGSFSSRLAFINSGIVEDSHILMALPHYENPLFIENHKAIFKYLLFLDDEYHSVMNLPFSWYNELLGEYGMIGLLLFSICYLGFFIKRIHLLTYGKLLLVVMLAFFLFDYWYQRLSVMVFFELFMLLDMKMTLEKNKKTE